MAPSVPPAERGRGHRSAMSLPKFRTPPKTRKHLIITGQSCNVPPGPMLKHLLIWLFAAGVIAPVSAAPQSSAPPNIVIIFTDDQGYADVGKFGAEGFVTPNLDRMAD